MSKNYLDLNGLTTYDGLLKTWVGGPIRELTYAQYQALSQAEKMNGTNYYITDVISGDIVGLGTAATKDVPTSGDASTTQVVMGNDSRLTDSRNAADVYAWAKAATKPTYTASEVGAASGAGIGLSVVEGNLVITYDDGQ